MIATWYARSFSLHMLFGQAAVLTLATHLALVACQAQEAAKKTQTTSQVREQRIEAALLDDTSVEFVETPLQDVLDFLKDMHSIEIQLDSKALEAASIGSDSPITRNLKGITLASALRQFLGNLGLTYVVRDEVLLITTPDASREIVEVRVYNVSDLVTGDEASTLADRIQRALTGALPESPRQLTPAPLVAPGAAPTPAPSSRPMVNQDVNIVSIEPFHGSLIVRANYQGHKATEKLLAELRNKPRKSEPTPTAPAPKAPAKTVPKMR